MANVDNPRGLRCLGLCLSGGAPQVEEYWKAVNYNKAIFPGDAVNQVAGGGIETSATPGASLYLGAVLGGYGPVLTLTPHLVTITPDARYEAQATTAPATARGLNANLLLTAGDTVVLKSKHSINGAAIAVTATHDVKMLKLMPIPGNEAGAFSAWEVSFNPHRHAAGTVGV
jgi:hypothetical protein